MQLCRTPSPVRRLDLRARNGLLGFLTGVFFSQSEYWDWDAQDFDPWKLMDQILLECLNHFNHNQTLMIITQPLLLQHYIFTHCLLDSTTRRLLAFRPHRCLPVINVFFLFQDWLFAKSLSHPFRRENIRGDIGSAFIYTGHWCTEILTLTCHTRK